MNTLSIQLAELENAQLVRALAEEEPAYLFKHALTQDTAYESLLVKKRREIHRRVAEGYEGLYADRLDEYTVVLAYHYAQAGDDVKTIEYSLRAAEAAMRIFAYPEARGHFTRGLDAFRRLPDTPEHIRRRVDAVFWYLEAAWGASDPNELIGLVSEAEALLLSLRKPDGTVGDPLRLVQIHQQLTGLHFARGDYREVIHYAGLGLDEASMLDDKTLLAPHSTQMGMALLAQGHFADAVPYFSQAIGLSEETPDRWEWFFAVGALGITLGMRGRVTEGLAEAERALARMVATNNHFGMTQCQANLLPIYLQQGDMTRLVEESERTIAVAAKSSMPLFESLGLGFKSLAQSRLGRHQDAHETMKASRDVGARVGGQFFMSDWLAAANAEIVLNAGRTQEAIELAEQTIAKAKSLGGIFAEGWVERVWANALAAEMAPQLEEAESHLACSLELLESGGALLEAAQTRIAWGNVLEARGKPEQAREYFEEAAMQFQASELTSRLEGTQRLICALVI